MAEGGAHRAAAAIRVTVLYSPRPRGARVGRASCPPAPRVLQALEASGLARRVCRLSTWAAPWWASGGARRAWSRCCATATGSRSTGRSRWTRSWRGASASASRGARGGPVRRAREMAPSPATRAGLQSLAMIFSRRLVSAARCASSRISRSPLALVRAIRDAGIEAGLGPLGALAVVGPRLCALFLRAFFFSASAASASFFFSSSSLSLPLSLGADAAGLAGSARRRGRSAGAAGRLLPPQAA